MGDLRGRSLGAYQVLEQLGAGGMATVYKAYQPAMDRYVAIKVLPQHMALDPGFRERFAREARTIARLEHRFILPVYDALEADGIPFLVMRYTGGGTLADLIAAGPVPLTRAMQFVEQVAEALAYAHAQGVIHRDIKPANVLLDRDGTALLTDFGIAKIVEGALPLTTEGVLIGTPFYMAPEQAQGRAADARTDIYALGVVLYELVTGRRPYVAETPLAVAMMHIHEPLPLPRQLNPAIPEPLERVLLKALAKRPEDRFQAAGEMVVALRAATPAVTASLEARDAELAQVPVPAGATVLLPETRPVPIAPARGPRRWPWILAGCGALVAALAALLLLRPTATPLEPAAQATTVLPDLATSGVVSQPTVLPSAVPVASGPTVTSRAGLTVFSDTSEVNALVALGDTVWLATNGGLVRYGADGTSRTFTTADGLPFNSTPVLAAAPDGTLWAGAYGRVAHIRPVADGIGEITSYGESDGLDIGGVDCLVVDPVDGSVWVCGEKGVRHFDGNVWKQPDIPLDTTVITEGSSRVVSLLRAADGARWLARENDGLLRWDGAQWSRYGAAEGVGQSSFYRLLQARDGTLWASAGEHGLLRFDAEQNRWTQAVAPPQGGYIGRVGQLADGRLWLETSSGLEQSDAAGTSWRPVDVPSGYLGSGGVAQTSDGRLWVGGASVFADGSWRKLPSRGPVSFSSAARIVASPDGMLWVLELYGGLATVIDPQSLAVERHPLDERIYAVAFGENTRWFGTSNGIVRERNGARLNITAADGLPSDEIRQLLVTDATLWVGTNNGLATYDLAGEQIASIPEFEGGIVDVLLQAPDGAIWAGSHRENEAGYGLLGRFDGNEWRLWRAGELPNAEDQVEVTRLALDSIGQLWLLTWSSGLYRWDGERWEMWIAEDGAPQSTLLAAAARGDEVLIGGDMGATLFRWTTDGWSTLPIDGLSGRVNDILVTADGALWLATDDGLLRVAVEAVR